MRVRWIFVLLCLIVALLFASRQQQTAVLQAQAGGQYLLTSHTTTAGGVTAAGAYQANVTLGQAEAGLQTGGVYELGGGFWGGGPVTEYTPLSRLFLPAILR